MPSRPFLMIVALPAAIVFLSTAIHAQAGDPKNREPSAPPESARSSETESPATAILTTREPTLAEMESAAETDSPSRALILNNLGTRYAELGRMDEAIRTLQRAVVAAPALAKAHLNLSIVYDMAGRPADAIAAARTAVELDPSRLRARGQLCGLYMAVKRYAEAAECFKGAMPLAADDPVFRANYGVALLRAGDKKGALRHLTEVVEASGPLAGVYNALGVAQFQNKRLKEAVASFKRAVELDPAVPEFRYNLGITQMARSNRAGALSQYNFLKRSDPALAARIYKVIFSGRVVAAPEP